MKITIEVNVPEGVDLDHAYQSVTDALASGGLFSDKYTPHRVTTEEGNLVASVLNQLAKERAKQLPKNGFRDWAETHHEVVCTIHALIDNNTMPKRLLDILDKEGFYGLYDLGIELTNNFCRIYENEGWDVDSIIYFVNLKLQ